MHKNSYLRYKSEKQHITVRVDIMDEARLHGNEEVVLAYFLDLVVSSIKQYHIVVQVYDAVVNAEGQ